MGSNKILHSRHFLLPALIETSLSLSPFLRILRRLTLFCFSFFVFVRN